MKPHQPNKKFSAFEVSNSSADASLCCNVDHIWGLCQVMDENHLCQLLT